MKYKISKIPIYTFFILNFCFHVFGQTPVKEKKVPPPTIQVTAGFDIVEDKDEPGKETTNPYFKWETTNAEYVFILGEGTQLEAKGKLYRGGSLIFVAVGPGGTASQAIAARVVAKPGPGKNNRIYSIDTDFNPDYFFQNAQKANFAVNKTSEEFASIAVDILQRMGYRADDTRRVQNYPIVFTMNHLPNANLPNQTDVERNDRVNVLRHLDFIVLAKEHRLYVLPVVMVNYPEDDKKKWIVDKTNASMGDNAASVLAKDIISAASR
jgi:hypothetical protein